MICGFSVQEAGVISVVSSNFFLFDLIKFLFEPVCQYSYLVSENPFPVYFAPTLKKKKDQYLQNTPESSVILGQKIAVNESLDEIK